MCDESVEGGGCLRRCRRTSSKPWNSRACSRGGFLAIATPTSQRYLSHLSLKEASGILAASNEDIEATKDWLERLQFKNIKVSALRDTVTAKISCDKVDYALLTRSSCPVKVDFVLRKDFRNAPAFAAKAVPISRKSAIFQGSYSIPKQKEAYGIPLGLAAQNRTLQMVWGPGTFGFSMSELEELKNSQVPLLNVDKVKFDTDNHGKSGGDNFGEGNLDTQMITAFGLNCSTIVSNTNASMSTEEGQGFGLALLDFLTDLANRETVPHVLSLSLGSLSAYSCDLLCSKAVELGHTKADCEEYLQTQRQVCMFLSRSQTDRINTALKVLGIRGVSIFGSSGDGGSHYSFSPFSGHGKLSDDLNAISCNYTLPVFPTTSPYIISVGGTEWKGTFFPDSTKPIAWSQTGGGFAWEFNASEYQNELVSKYLSAASKLPSFPASGTFNEQGRAYPDISAVAVEGTSQSSPIMAGIFLSYH